MDTTNFGKHLRRYREEYGWSIKECAEKMGISTQYLSDIERGLKVPKLETFIDILNALSASADIVLQDSLIVAYIAKSNELSIKLKSLDDRSRKQALDIFDRVIDVLNEK